MKCSAKILLEGFTSCRAAPGIGAANAGGARAPPTLSNVTYQRLQILPKCAEGSTVQVYASPHRFSIPIRGCCSQVSSIAANVANKPAKESRGQTFDGSLSVETCGPVKLPRSPSCLVRKRTSTTATDSIYPISSEATKAEPGPEPKSRMAPVVKITFDGCALRTCNIAEIRFLCFKLVLICQSIVSLYNNTVRVRVLVAFLDD